MRQGLLLAHGGGIQSFVTDFNTMLWSAVLRMLETVASAAPYLVVGLLFAGFLRGLVGAARLRRALDAGPWAGPFRAWALGTLLPVCALGALPVACELKRARIAGGTVLAFLLAAPLFNPITLIYAISIVPLSTLVYFVCGTALISVGIGGIWNTWIEPPASFGTADESLEWPPARSDLRLAVAGGTVATGFSRRFLLDFAIVVLAMGLAGAFLPYAVFQATLTPGNPWSPLMTALAGVLFYVDPIEAVRVVGLTIRDGFSIGAAFSFLVIGAGAVTAAVNGIRRDFGWRRAGQFASLLLLSTLALAYAADLVLPRSFSVTQAHTHAFDGFTRQSAAPADAGNGLGLIENVWQRLRSHERVGLGALGGLLLAGAVLKLGGARTDVGRLMRTTPPETAPASNLTWNRALTPRQLAIAVLVVGCVLSVGGLYLYYPPTDQIVGDLDNLRFDIDEAVRTKNEIEAVARIDEFRELAARLPLSDFLRKGFVAAVNRHGQRDGQRVSQAELIYSLDTLDEFVKENQFEEATAAMRYMMDSYNACRREYLMNGS
jgi:uncharacterized protein